MKNKIQIRKSPVKSLIFVVLIILPLVLGCGMLKNIASRSTTDFNPYKGSLNDLLKPELSGSLVKFKSKGSRDIATDYPGSTEAKGFTYMQEVAGVEVQVDGALVNYPTALAAETKLTDIAATNQSSLTTRGKGKKFIAKEGAIVGWTNGSIMCVVVSDFAKPAGNFEAAAPF